MATIEQIKNYISTVYPIAERIAKARNYPSHIAKVCLIQGALESGYGTATIMVKYNALFGVKANSMDIANGTYYECKTLEYDSQLKKYVSVMAKFKAFKTLEENISHYYDLISNKRYGACLYSKDVKEALTIIWSCGYATAPDYVTKCLSVEKILNKYMNTNYNYYVATERDNLNVRDKPNGNIIGSLAKGTKLYANDDWYYIPELNGFVSNKYLKRIEVNKNE